MSNPKPKPHPHLALHQLLNQKFQSPVSTEKIRLLRKIAKKSKNLEAYIPRRKLGLRTYLVFEAGLT
jgi:hypothetical protein